MEDKPPSKPFTIICKAGILRTNLPNLESLTNLKIARDPDPNNELQNGKLKNTMEKSNMFHLYSGPVKYRHGLKPSAKILNIASNENMMRMIMSK